MGVSRETSTRFSSSRSLRSAEPKSAICTGSAATLAPVGYVVLVWAAIFGVFFFGELPSVAAVAGALFIVLGTWLTQKR